jgi:REP element-mobilizing transposase RayT
MTKSEPLQYGRFYHIYNRGNNRETIFRSSENYRFFLQRYGHYVEPVAATYAYCLLPNHFHLLVYIRTEEEQLEWQRCQLSESWHLSSWQPSEPRRAFQKLFISYAMAFNRRYERTGSLFQKPFKRKPVDSDRYFVTLVQYIHRNPELHGLVDDFREWSWSSYGALLSEKPTRVERAEVLDWYGGRTEFEDAHAGEMDERLIEPLVEDDWM